MKRRTFVKNSGLATTLLAATSVIGATGYALTGSKKLKIGVIGTGVRGKGLLNIINGIDQIEVIACCDTLNFNLAAGLKIAGKNAVGYTDYKKLLANKEVDAVIVTVPFYLHTQVAMDAIDADKHVYCEKTLAKGYTGIQELVAKVGNSKNIFQVGHQYHSSRLYSHIVALIQQGKIGVVSSFECQWNRHGDWRKPVPTPELEEKINWRMYKAYSGGLLAELSSHQIDFVNWVLEEHPEQVMGFGGVDYWKDGRETYDNIHIIYKYPKGVKAKFSCLTTNASEGFKIKVMGDKGTIVIDYDTAWFYPEGKKTIISTDVDGVAGATAKYNGLGEELTIKHLEPSKQALVDFQQNISNGTEPNSNIRTGAMTAICIQMGLDAMYTNSIVNWNSSFNQLITKK